MAFLHVSHSVSMISLGISTVSPQCLPRFLFQILRTGPNFPTLPWYHKYPEIGITQPPDCHNA